MQNLKEIALLNALKSGRLEAFDALYYAYHKKLFAFIFKITKNWQDSEDLLQNIFKVIWEKRANIDPEKSFNNYLFRIARNEIYDLLKKRALTEYCNEFIICDSDQNEENVEKERLLEIVCQLVNKLPERRRQIFQLNRDKGLTYKQIGTELNISENTVDTQIRNSLNYLRKELKRILKGSELIVKLILLFFPF